MSSSYSNDSPAPCMLEIQIPAPVFSKDNHVYNTFLFLHFHLGLAPQTSADILLASTLLSFWDNSKIFQKFQKF